MKTFTKIAHYLGLSACALYMLVGLVCMCTMSSELAPLMKTDIHTDTGEDGYARWIYWTFFGGCWTFVHYFVTPIIMAVLIAMHVFQFINAKWYKILLIVLLAIWVLWMHGPAAAFQRVQLAQNGAGQKVLAGHGAGQNLIKAIADHAVSMWFPLLTTYVSLIFLHLNLWSIVCCDVCTKDEDQEELEYGEEDEEDVLVYGEEDGHYRSNVNAVEAV